MAFLWKDVTDDGMIDSYVRVMAYCGTWMESLLTIGDNCDPSRCLLQKEQVPAMSSTPLSIL